MENLEYYKDAIITKLRTLEKKISISYRSTSDSDKRHELRKHLTILDGLFRKIELEIIEWEDLLHIGISKRAIMDLVNTDSTPAQNTNLEEIFPMVSKIPHLEFLSDNIYMSDKVNSLYSIIEFVNINYQTIFAQKILLSASKTNSMRELFYNQYQDIFRTFNSYKSLAIIPSKSEDFVKMLNKEYFQILKTIYNFFISIKLYMELISDDDTFSDEDFQHNIVTADVTSCIAQSTLREALDECYSFIEEAMSYIQNDNRDIFDSISIGQEIKSKN